MQEQGLIQDAYSERLDHLNDFRQKMADIQLEFNPLSQVALVQLVKKDTDIYGDTQNQLEQELTKRVHVKKNPSLIYLQDEFDFLVEDSESTPVVITMTTTGLPRLVNHDDRVIIGNIVYTISTARPANRLSDTIIKLTAYPERT